MAGENGVNCAVSILIFSEKKQNYDRSDQIKIYIEQRQINATLRLLLNATQSRRTRYFKIVDKVPSLQLFIL